MLNAMETGLPVHQNAFRALLALVSRDHRALRADIFTRFASGAVTLLKEKPLRLYHSRCRLLTTKRDLARRTSAAACGSPFPR